MTAGIVLSPKPVVREAASTRAVRPDIAERLQSGSLGGLTMGIRRDQHWLSWDWVTDRWAATLEARGAKVVMWRAASQIGKEGQVVRKELDEFIDTVDVAIFGLANCGGCTMETVRDAQLSMTRGVPTMVASTAEFENLARQLAVRSGWSEIGIVVLPFPLESKTRQEVDGVADEYITSVLARLVDAC